MLFLKKPFCTGDLLPAHKIFIEGPELNLMRKIVLISPREMKLHWKRHHVKPNTIFLWFNLNDLIWEEKKNFFKDIQGFKKIQQNWRGFEDINRKKKCSRSFKGCVNFALWALLVPPDYKLNLALTKAMFWAFSLQGHTRYAGQVWHNYRLLTDYIK